MGALWSNAEDTHTDGQGQVSSSQNDGHAQDVTRHNDAQAQVVTRSPVVNNKRTGYTAFGQGGSGQKKGTGTEALSDQRAGAADGQITFVFDGRGQRLQQSSCEVHDKVNSVLSNLVFEEE